MDGIGIAIALIFVVIMFFVIIFTIVIPSTTEQPFEVKAKMEIKDAEEFMEKYDEMNNTKPIQRVVVQPKKCELTEEQKEALDEIDGQILAYKLRHFNKSRNAIGWALMVFGVLTSTFFSLIIGFIIGLIGIFLSFDQKTPFDEELSKATVNNMIKACQPLVNLQLRAYSQGKNTHIYDVFIRKFPEKESNTLKKLAKMKWS